ncbi:hypothetical protein AMK23_34250 [Streptomyces sp. CB02130]|uniref:hypothetical protein n=1 Tax=Streptomyces sp. CB02130 TaxID=1703934 RepID=UPI00093E2F4E|nr:hypothetical protein [Streptomyces sp. CB02130]OKJ19363.1 hypothetical protein AMK23_34250 [Streptomyces sp. CB02130]
MNAAEMWTPENLRSPVDRAIYLEQRRAQLLPIVDDLRRIAREMEAEVKEVGAIAGDLPGQARIRAWHTVKPLFSAADDVEKAISDLISFNGRYQKSYEELPAKREEKRQAKALAKGQGQQAIESPSAGTDPGPPQQTSQFADVFDGLKRGA